MTTTAAKWPNFSLDGLAAVAIFSTIMDIAQKLRQAVRDCGKSQLQLSVLARVPQSAISRFVNGGPVTTVTLGRLAKALGIEIRFEPVVSGVAELETLALSHSAANPGRPKRRAPKVRPGPRRHRK